MRVISKIIILICALLIFSCTPKAVETKSFIDKINVENWDSKTFKLMKAECSLEKYEYYHKRHREGYIVLSTNDTIFSVEDQVKNYAKYRRNFLSKLKEKINMLPSKTSTMVIAEQYHDIDNPGISYTVFSNNMDKGLRFYFKSDKFDEIQELEEDFKEYGYDSIVKKKPKCIVEYTGHLNQVGFETVIFINSQGEIVYDVKEAYFGAFVR